MYSTIPCFEMWPWGRAIFWWCCQQPSQQTSHSGRFNHPSNVSDEYILVMLDHVCISFIDCIWGMLDRACIGCILAVCGSAKQIFVVSNITFSIASLRNSSMQLIDAHAYLVCVRKWESEKEWEWERKTGSLCQSVALCLSSRSFGVG